MLIVEISCLDPEQVQNVFPAWPHLKSQAIPARKSVALLQRVKALFKVLLCIIW